MARRVTTQELFEALQIHSAEDAEILSKIQVALASIDTRLERVDKWAFGGNGEHSMEARVKQVELARAKGAGKSLGVKIVLGIIVTVLTLLLGAIGAVIGLAGSNLFMVEK